MINKVVIVLAAILVWSCNDSKKLVTADDLSITWSVDQNLGGTYQSTWEITNNGKQPLGEGWALYYNQVAGVPVLETLPSEVLITQISGTFYSITPAAGFHLKPRASVKFGYTAGGAAIKITDAPTGLYLIVDSQDEPQVIYDYKVSAFTEPGQINRSDIDRVPIPSPKVRYHANEKLTYLSADATHKIIPTPVSYQASNETFELPQEIRIAALQGLEDIADLLAARLRVKGRSVSMVPWETEADIILAIDSVKSSDDLSESYTLTVAENGITISGEGKSGVFYGTQSLLSLLPLSYWESEGPTAVSGVTIYDYPRFPYRGMHLDVSRNFHQPEAVKKLMDIMAFYKLNKFHFHLTDDEGWRLAIKGLPELTNVGATRGHTSDETDHLYPAYGSGPFPHAPDNFGTGHYSREEFIDLLQYAQARNIEVIPEINFPGHARAAIKAMEARERRIQAEENSTEPSFLLSDPQDSSLYKSVQGYDDNVICVCKESVYKFIEFVVSDLVSIYQEADVSLTTIHTGGDEVPAGIWEKSPACAGLLTSHPELNETSDLSNYFLTRYHEILKQQDLITAGWEEIAMHKVATEVGGEDDPTNSRKIMVPNPEFADSNFLAYVWLSIWGVAGEDLAYQLANRGYKVVMSNASNFYFDFAYDKDPSEPGFYWAGLVNTRKPFELTPLDVMQTATNDIMGNPLTIDRFENYERLTAEGRKNILGIQGQLWSETVKGQQQMEYYVFPKLMGLAERAWAQDPPWSQYEQRTARLEGLEEAWNVFANSMAQNDLPRLDHMWDSVNYRVPLPGAIIENGQLKANVAFPGLKIVYTLDGTEPDENALEYTEPVDVRAGTTVKLRSFTSTGKGSRTSSLLAE